MKVDEISQVAIIGAGLMGHGIALEFALAGYHVHLHSRSKASLERGLRNIQDSLHRLEALGKVTSGQVEEALPNIRSTTTLQLAVREADVVFESVYEDLDLKRQVFRKLDELCPGRTILASNSSALMPSEYASATRRPDRVIGAHYINPPFLVPLVEVVPSAHTSASTIQSLTNLLIRVGKRPVVLNREVPGFVSSRLQGALLREALWIVENGVATAQDVDVVIKSSIGRRWAVAGVFEVLDIAGWDLIQAYATVLFPHLASSTRVPAVLNERVERGELGVKTGKGFNEWTPESAEALKQRIAQALVQIDQWS